MVVREAALEPRPEREHCEHDEREERAAPERVRDDGCAADRDVEAGHEPERADKPPEVPVGLGAVGAQPGSYGPHSQIGLICTSPPSAKSTPPSPRRGRASAAPGRGTWERRRVAARSRAGRCGGTACGGAAPRAPGARHERREDRREHEHVRDEHARLERRIAGKGPPQISWVRLPPTTGSDSATP